MRSDRYSGRRRLPASVAAMLAILIAATSLIAVLYAGGRSDLLQRLPGWPRPTPALAGTVQRSQAGAYWGAFLPGADGDQSIVTKFAAGAGRQPAIVSVYQAWGGEPSFPTDMARWLSNRGMVPLVVWEPWQAGLTGVQGVEQARYRLSAIASGAFDAYARRYADEVRAYAGPVLLETMHEMNGDWYPWGGTVNGNSAVYYVAAWRHLHDLFQQEGAANATWTWTPNGETAPNTAANQPERYWPGPQYVDWVGIDSYNWGISAQTQWRTPAQMFSANIAALAPLGKPIILAETASVDRGGDKAAWITSLFDTVTGAYRDTVGAVVWFDKPIPSFDWRTNSTPAAQAAFASAVARPGMLSAGQVVISAPAPAAGG